MTNRFKTIRLTAILAVSAAYAVLTGCTTGPHPTNQSATTTGGKEVAIKATTTGPHPSSKE